MAVIIYLLSSTPDHQQVGSETPPTTLFSFGDFVWLLFYLKTTRNVGGFIGVRNIIRDQT